VANIVAASAQVRGVAEGTAARVELRHEGVILPAVEGRVEGARGRREVRRPGVPGQVGAADPVDRDADAGVEVASAKVGGVAKIGAGLVELCHEGVVLPVEGRVEGARGRREVGRVRAPGHVGAAGAVDCDAVADFAAASAQVGGVAERGAARVQLRHEGIAIAIEGRVEGARGRREVRRVREPGHVGAAGAVERDGGAVVGGASAQVGGVEEGVAALVEPGHERVVVAVVGRVEGAR
jgi:hypothetical protein